LKGLKTHLAAPGDYGRQEHLRFGREQDEDVCLRRLLENLQHGVCRQLHKLLRVLNYNNAEFSFKRPEAETLHQIANLFQFDENTLVCDVDQIGMQSLLQLMARAADAA